MREGKKEMPWEIKILEKEGLVSSVCSGIMDYNNMIQMFSESIDAGNKYKINRYLADSRKTKHDLSVAEIYMLPKTLKEKGFTSGDKIALLTSKKSVEQGQLHFIETVSDIKDLNLKLFTDKKKAYEWIK